MHNNQSNLTNKTMRSYAKRRVNPFLGVMQVVEAEEGRALSCNGIVWEILVRASQASTCESHAHDAKNNKYYRFGMWSMDSGLMKRANSPADDQQYFDLASKCETLIEYVRSQYHLLPFTLEDNHELWMLDKDNQQPLALLASSVPGVNLTSPEPIHWTSCIGANGSPSQRRFPQAQDLELQVSQRAGLNIQKHWIKRLPGGEGIVENSAKSIPADQFPILLLDENWVNEEEQLRAREYVKWISPSLLTLQHLDKSTRTRIEKNLSVQAISVEHHWHLYPEIINQTLLKAARVQSQIEQCS